MPTLKENAFTFSSQALANDAFTVVRFSGEEGLSLLYSFDILLVTEDEEIDLGAVLHNPATFTIKGKFSGGDDLPFHGILASFEQLHQVGGYTFYRAELRPKMWWLTLTHHNQIFLNLKPLAFMQKVLDDGGLFLGTDFEFRSSGNLPNWEYVCQYNESHFAFVSRWLEREGLYFWFEQGAEGEKLIASDTLMAHTPLPDHETFLYSQPSGLDGAEAGRVIKRFTLKQSPMPQKVLLKDYNYMKPSLGLEGKAAVREQGRGEVYLYGENFPDNDEGTRLAKIRAEEFICREKVFHGLSSIPAIRPGYLFTLERHYNKGFNQQYLTTSVIHEGSQERYLLSGLGLTDLEEREALFYRNNFKCIPGSTQFRPPLLTPKPRITGTISAKIDAAGSGQYAELDEHGRYKVLLPFDLSGRKDGKASAPIRMMQPYAGANQGMHFPLRKGTEVLLTFLDGDPDRPIIAGALPNPEARSPVDAGNQTMANLTTGGGNKLHMEDQEGSEGITLQSPLQSSYLAVGASPAYPTQKELANEAAREGWDKTKEAAESGADYAKEKWDEASNGGITIFSYGDMKLNVQNKSETMTGMSSSTVLGSSSSTVVGFNTSQTIGSNSEMVLGPKTVAHCGKTTEFDSWKSALIPLYTTFCGKKGTVVMSGTEMKGTMTSLYTHHMKLLGAVEKLEAQLTELQGEKSTMAGEVSELKGMVNKLEGENTTLQGQVTKLSGTVTEIEGESSTIAGKVQNLEGSVTNLRGDITNVEGNMVRLSTSVAEVGGFHSKV